MSCVCTSIEHVGLISPQAKDIPTVMDSDYVKSVVKGLTLGHICLGFAATAAFITVVTVGWTQWEFLVSWVPVILIAVFLSVTTVLLQRDMANPSGGKNR